jgi:integrase
MSQAAVSSSDILALRVQPRTRETYLQAMKKFSAWLKPDAILTSFSDFPFLNFPASELDSLLVEYCTFLFNQPKSHFSRASTIFSAVLFFAPRLRFQLPNCHALLKAWTKSTPPPKKSPIPWSLALILARICCEQKLLGEAVAFLLMHHTYLRVNNILKLKKSDVICDLQDLDSRYPIMILRLDKTKTESFQFVPVKRQDLADVLAVYISRVKNDDDFIFDFSYSHLSNVLKRLCKHLGLSHFDFTLHKFRHGGASDDYLKSEDFLSVKRRGLWKSDSSADRYISSGVCFSILTSLPKEFLRIGKMLDADLTKCFDLSARLF